jgi:hypothetical protein
VDKNPFLTTFPVLRGETIAQQVDEAIGLDGIIAGSYAAFMCSPNDLPRLPGDLDIFAYSVDGWHRIAKRLVEQGQDRPDGFRTYSEVSERVYRVYEHPSGIDIQIMQPNPKWEKWPEDCLNDFDLDVCRAALVAPHVVLADENIGQPNGKVLRINDPLRTLRRLAKYMAGGVQFLDHEVLKVFRAWEALTEERRSEIVEKARADAWRLNRADREEEGQVDSGWAEDDFFDGE